MEASSPQSVDPSVGRHLAETVCSTCHQFASGRKFGCFEFYRHQHKALKTFFRSSDPMMPNFILTPEEIDSVTAYILGSGPGSEACRH